MLYCFGLLSLIKIKLEPLFNNQFSASTSYSFGVKKVQTLITKKPLWPLFLQPERFWNIVCLFVVIIKTVRDWRHCLLSSQNYLLRPAKVFHVYETWNCSQDVDFSSCEHQTENKYMKSFGNKMHFSQRITKLRAINNVPQKLVHLKALLNVKQLSFWINWFWKGLNERYENNLGNIKWTHYLYM